MNTNPGKLVLKDVRRRFDRSAACFAGADFVHQAAFDGIIERLAPMTVKPSLILDLGSAIGSGSRKLGRQFRGARVVSLDVSMQMLRQGKSRRTFFSKVRELQGDARRMPLRTGSVDLVFANMLFPWIDDLSACFGEIARVLRKDGVFVFSSLGPDSLREIRDAWRDEDLHSHVNTFPDMHDVGDLLLRAGLRHSVLDADALSITYRDIKSLYRDLSDCGARNCLASRRQSLTGKQRFRRVESALLEHFGQGPLEFRLELVYGHAWGGGPQGKAGEIYLDPGLIGRRQR